MKLHSYKCLDCDCHYSEEAINAPDCPECGSENTAMDCHIAIHGNYRHPIHSDALAIHPDQRTEHEQLFPNIRIDKQNRPVFDNFIDHEAYLKKCNIVKGQQRIRSLGKKRITP